jgi:hypothetical protein
MVLPKAILLALGRWLRLLRSSSLSQATELLRVGSEFSDLTMTQYAAALEWATTCQLLVDGPHGLQLCKAVRDLPDSQFGQMLFRILLEQASPFWLADADVLIPTPQELPQDASDLAENLGINEIEAFIAIKQLHGLIDIEQRSLIGTAGERAMVTFLEKHWPGSTNHVALTDDGFGYDVVFRHGVTEWHLEVKSTLRRGRLVVHLSRHEHEIGMLDPAWRLVVLALDEQFRLRRIATVRHLEVLRRAPNDVCREAKWQSASHQLSSHNLEVGFPFIVDSDIDRILHEDLRGAAGGEILAVHECSWIS